MSRSAKSPAQAMRQRRRPQGGMRCLWHLLLVLPFVLLSLMAPGTMAATGPDGQVHIVICAGDGPMDMVMLADGTLIPASDAALGEGAAPSGGDDHGAHHTSCAWAVHAQPVLETLAVLAPGPVLRVTPVGYVAPVAQHHRRLAVLAPSARGPPRDQL